MRASKLPRCQQAERWPHIALSGAICVVSVGQSRLAERSQQRGRQWVGDEAAVETTTAAELGAAGEVSEQVAAAYGVVEADFSWRRRSLVLSLESEIVPLGCRRPKKWRRKLGLSLLKKQSTTVASNIIEAKLFLKMKKLGLWFRERGTAEKGNVLFRELGGWRQKEGKCID